MRIIILVLGSMLLLLGVVSMFTPILGGTMMITIGGGMIICSSDTAARYVQVCRAKFGRFNRAMTWLENKMGFNSGTQSGSSGGVMVLFVESTMGNNSLVVSATFTLQVDRGEETCPSTVSRSL